MIRLVRRVPQTVFMAVALAVLGQPVQAQQDRTKWLRIETGYSSNHEGDDNSIGGAVRLVFPRADRGVRVETGLIVGNPYAGLDVGLEVRFPRDARLGFVARAGGGLLLEDGYTGPFFRGGGGIELEVSPRLALRATAQAGSHDGEGGPHHLYVGLDYHW